MCLSCTEDDDTQVNPEGPRGQHPSQMMAKQITDKRIQSMRNLRKEKRRLSKQFARPNPTPEPGILWS
ncbi:coiled-coil domain-containing protein 179 [Erinaceus europaeus]|uniref:Coiled-coil domain-containing protein 179 n=1 Tax=Erinaceus europaeus TaxID=9365 RepID=A0ABM3W8U3_ERIEU|nr:coiled-coil domain-containing protein 179 [Erinaceus europaeus]